MASIRYHRGDEQRTPHAPDALERDVGDGGFSSGWAPHAKPIPDYYFDFHVHYLNADQRSIGEVIRPDLDRALAQRVKRTLLIVRAHDQKAPDLSRSTELTGDTSYSIDTLRRLGEGLPWDENVVLSTWMYHSTPEAELVRKSRQVGARCIKLHNAPVITEAASPDLWLSPAWGEAFTAMEELGLPVLWHVTQRLSSSAYTFGARNAYWQTGWEKGITFTNQDLLDVYLTLLTRHPKLNFVAAHQLHLGWERLDALFTGYPNLYVDTTVGCTLRFFDDFYPQDKAFLRAVFIKWADRILYGTDHFWQGYGNAGIEHLGNEHMNFLRALDLPHDVLQKICYGNAERLTGLATLR